MMLCRNAPRALTSRLTSRRCASLTPGIITELTLTRVFRGQHFEPQHLPFVQGCGPPPGQSSACCGEDPGVDLRADFRIDHVDRDRDMIDVHVHDLVDMVRERQAIGRNTELEIGETFGDEIERRLGVAPS